MNVGFSDYEESKEWGYLKFLRRRGMFRDLILAGHDYAPHNEGGDVLPRLRIYRGMLDMYKARPDDYDNFGRRRNFTPQDFYNGNQSRFTHRMKIQPHAITLRPLAPG